MKKLLAMTLGCLLLAVATPALAKVCYRCKDNRPVRYVCATKDTFDARKNARKAGCNWSSYTSSCKCGQWVSTKRGGKPPMKSSSAFLQYVFSLFSSPTPF
ncbi:MAG: hypothetical protein ABI333_01070 [bacterium]